MENQPIAGRGGAYFIEEFRLSVFDIRMNEELLEFGSLFSGIGGLDIGLEQAGLKCKFMVENDRHALTILNRHWPDVPKNEIRPCVGLVGGDPCPVRSVAATIHGSRQPDMSGYFLAMVARIKPQWVLRENVCAPDVVEFRQGLEVLGYRCAIVSADSAAVTGQSRPREYVVGLPDAEAFNRFRRKISKPAFTERNLTAFGDEAAPIACLTTRRQRMDTSQMYVFDGPEKGLRVLSHEERERLQGWPLGWTNGVPNSARERMTGNGVTAPVAERLGRIILECFTANYPLPKRW